MFNTATLDALPTVVSSAASVAVLWAIALGPYRWYRTDLFRQRLFAIRDEAFDLAAEGRVGFEAPAYAQLRATINGYLRFAERFGVIHIVLAQLFVPNQVFAASSFVESAPRWEANTADLSPDIRDALNAMLQRVHHEVVFQILLASPVSLFLAVLVALPVLAWRLCTLAVRRAAHGPYALARHFARSWLDSADTTAFIAGTA